MIAVVVAPGDRLAVEVVQREDALLVAFDHRADQAAGGDGVDAQLVAELVGVEHGGEVVHAQVRAEHGAGLVLRPLGDRAHVLALLDQADVAAAHGAGEAGACRRSCSRRASSRR